ncbi:hypothetical protein ACQWTT_001167 [Acinetobacter baumannii]
MTPLVNIPQGFKLVPLELTDEQAEIVANKEIDDSLKTINRTRADYTQTQLKDWISSRKTEAKKRYAAAIAMLNLN